MFCGLLIFQMVDSRSKVSPSSLSLHSANCDKLYRWAMWRMHINEDMSRKISDRRDFGDRSASVTSVTLPYLKHPDCCKYGKLMRKRFGRVADVGYYRDRLRLSDSQYLIYGIPRVTLNKTVPAEVKTLYRSCPNIRYLPENTISETRERTEEVEKRRESDESDQITELFKFVSFDHTPETSSQTSSHETHSTGTKDATNTQTLLNENANLGAMVSDDIDKERLVTRSKVFWKKLAERKHDIIELGKENDNKTPEIPSKSHEEHIISSDILLKQQKLLKATPKPKTSKDLWRNLSDRKTEILKMSENVKHKESKSSQLWNFIASRKNDLLHIKRGHKNANDVPGGKPDNQKTVSVLHKEPAHQAADSVPKPCNFQDSFQMELEARLRQRRNREQTNKEDT